MYPIEFIKTLSPVSGVLQDHLVTILYPENFKIGETLIRKGPINDRLYFIVKGLVHCFYTTLKGKEVSQWFLKENDVVASLESYANKVGSQETVVALEDTQTYMMKYEDLDRTYELYPEFERHGRLITTHYNIFWYNYAKQLKMDTVEDRYRHLRDNYPDIIQRVPNRLIASYLKTTQWHLSRIKGSH
jgi:CRP-like cAMP-binding protein